MSRITIAIDNGTTGSLAILGPDGTLFEAVPTKEMLMGKAGKVVRRIDHAKLHDILAYNSGTHPQFANVKAYIERPFTGSAMMINTTVLSARAYEATLIVLEQLGIGHETVDSKTWQLPMLGSIKGSPALKKASKLRGMAMYPALAASIKSHGDADSLLMAHHFHHNHV